MVAGMSSRFGGKIKQFARVGKNGETLIEISINQALKAGFNKIIFIVGNLTEVPFKEMFGTNYKGIPIFYAKQTFDPSERDKPWGTCDALVSAKEVIDESFVVCNGDDLYGENSFKILFNYLNEKNSSATLGFELGKVIPKMGGVNRAIYSFDKDNMVVNLNEIIGIEKVKLKEMGLNEKTLCSMNIFALTKDLVQKLEEKLQQFKTLNKNNRKIECYLPVELSKLIHEKKLDLKLISTPDDWLGITAPEDEPLLKSILAHKEH
jgi:choline kinase